MASENLSSPINWETWCNMPEVTPAQACLLSLNIDPGAVPYTTQAKMVAGEWMQPPFPDVDNQTTTEFNRRMQMLVANANNADFFTPGTINQNYTNTRRLRLSEFAYWASTTRIGNLPEQLVALAKKPEPQITSPATELSNAAAIVDETKLGEKERISMLKLVIGMAVGGYSYDPKAKQNDAIGDIKKDIEANGLSLDEGTIRKYLKAGAELMSPNRVD